MYRFLVFFLLSISLFTGCARNTQKNIPANPFFSFEKTACMGACPVYEFSLFEDGKAEYIGKKNVENIGTYEKKLTEEQLGAFKAILSSANLSQYDDSYRGNVSDLPTTKIYFLNEGKPKQITDYYGAPESLKETEKEIENLINSINWK